MLKETTLNHLPTNIRAPQYRREDVSVGIVHFGVGNFFRAHEAWYVDQCLALPGQSGWGIAGVGLNGGSRGAAKARAFQQQDGLYSLTEVAADGARTVSIIGALREYLLAPADPEAVLRRLADPETRIVSMTITEGGYNIDEKTGEFRLDTPAVQADLANPRRPATVFGYVVEGLRRRREAGVPAFTVMSCDNLRSNGHIAHTAFVGYARALAPDLAAWIEANVTFPCSMVDRITPGVDTATRNALNEASGLDDDLPVLAEDFSQWVLEDKFCNGRPALEKAGVQFVDDVAGYEQVKVRMLNASHILLGALGLLLGYRYAHETVEDADLERFANAYWTLDAIPQIDAPAGVDLDAYRQRLLSRFSNRAVADTLLRICSDGASKVQVFWTDTVRRSLTSGHDLERIAFGIAAYLEMLRGRDERGETYSPIEPTLDADQIALAAADDLAAGLALPAFDGWRDMDTTELDAAVVRARRAIRDQGVRASLPR
ncbi:mannitol dehydrogenase family protein [Komagataeibacter medellinensis]|uniref:NADPH-dependent L-sorbose reductase n=1 Tax=Komagataeibacter medellinensis (strain NBRC 3288 / BCRC 11682 / LMG 1693 / Kondo 51) TaxID=634177 RepID=G2I0L3_KOMMN|nr:mannitol dehydrogenase family protein [Komagataeibacter medellinensis]BAK84471.1 NADPH-dependent L-sorbose reductase [Komagataeibacter medellinensis NBRC 3288]